MSKSMTDFWDSNYYNHPSLTDDMIAIAEKQLGVKLPTLLIDLLKIQNGGYTKDSAYLMTQKTTWAADMFPFRSY